MNGQYQSVDVFLGFVFLFIGILIYLIPALIGRNKKSHTAILVLNILTGWTFIGWVIALVWACIPD
jgi:hypothetical protein